MSIITGLQETTTDFQQYNNLLIYHYELIVAVSLECFKFSSPCRLECAVSPESNQHPTESEVNQTPGLRQVHHRHRHQTMHPVPAILYLYNNIAIFKKENNKMAVLKMCQSPTTFILRARNSLSSSLRIEMIVIRPRKLR